MALSHIVAGAIKAIKILAAFPASQLFPSGTSGSIFTSRILLFAHTSTVKTVKTLAFNFGHAIR
jgi:hypothetical protein